MGMMIPGGPELSPSVATGSVTGTASSTASNANFLPMLGPFNAAISGTWAGGTMELQKSFDGGSTFVPVVSDVAGTPADFTTNAAVQLNEVEPGVMYRWQCITALTSGTVNWRISGGQRVT